MLPQPARVLAVLLFAVAGGSAAAGAETAELAAARRLAGVARSTILAAAAPAGVGLDSTEVERLSLGVNLSHYAVNPGADPAHYESFVEAARRILAGGATGKHTPDATSLRLDATALQLLGIVRALESAAPARDPQQAAVLADLRAQALLARFHARRALAAVHYNLFKRGLRLAELVAATYGEKEAVAVWRELVATAGNHPHAAAWRAELKQLEWNLKELEDQCCPPDEAILKEKVWEPATKAAPNRG